MCFSFFLFFFFSFFLFFFFNFLIFAFALFGFVEVLLVKALTRNLAARAYCAREDTKTTARYFKDHWAGLRIGLTN